MVKSSKLPKPKISVITPSFNQGQFIEATIKSVVSQDYPDWEYIINDAGSADQSANIIKIYARKYPRQIFWRSRADQGQVAAINEGLGKATGDIIAYLNSDDYYLPGCFRKVADYFNTHPQCLWLVGNCQVSESKLAWTFFLKHLWPIDRFPWALPVFNTINQPAVFIRKELVERVGLFNTGYKYSFDYDYWLRANRISFPYRIRQNLSVFRIHSDSLGTTGYKNQFKEDSVVIRKYTSDTVTLTLHRIITFITVILYTFLKR